jgi:hypothetical protein
MIFTYGQCITFRSEDTQLCHQKSLFLLALKYGDLSWIEIYANIGYGRG